MGVRLCLLLSVSACAPEGQDERIVVGAGEAEDASSVGKADGSEEEVRVELKVTLEPAEIEFARYRFGLDDDAGELRFVHFYDTLALDLFNAGVILRARKIVGDDDDSTVKIRPLDAENAEAWRETGDFKCEIDRTPTASVSSCSLSDRQGSAEIGLVAQGKRSIASLFDDAQEEFVATFGPDAPSFPDLVDLGAVETMVWKVESSQLDERMTFELWHLPDGSDILEVSIKVDAEDADDAIEDLLGYLDDHDLRVGEQQETKTRAAIEQLAARAAW